MCLTVVVFVAIAGCSFFGEADQVSFIATILEKNEMSLLVEPQAGSSELSSADKIVVAIKELSIVDAQNKEIAWEDVMVGERVEITYDGKIAESYPAQITK